MKMIFYRLIASVLVFASFGTGLLGQSVSAQGSSSLAIVGGTVVTMDKDRRVIEDGAVVVSGAKIVWVGKRSEIPARLRTARTIDATASR